MFAASKLEVTDRANRSLFIEEASYLDHFFCLSQAKRPCWCDPWPHVTRSVVVPVLKRILFFLPILGSRSCRSFRPCWSQFPSQIFTNPNDRSLIRCELVDYPEQPNACSGAAMHRTDLWPNSYGVVSQPEPTKGRGQHLNTAQERKVLATRWLASARDCAAFRRHWKMSTDGDSFGTGLGLVHATGILLELSPYMSSRIPNTSSLS